jgi:outer membrane protein assembly factor BamB
MLRELRGKQGELRPSAWNSLVVVNQYVFIAPGSSNLFGIDGSTGQQAWQVTLPAPFTGATTTITYSALSAGDGLLVVPTGTKVSAFVPSP